MNTLYKILDLLKEYRGFDFSGYRTSMLKRRIQKRIYRTNCDNIEGYLDYLVRDHNEFDNLIDVFTINVSGFFRNPLAFEYITQKIIPLIFHEKGKKKDNSLRIWSAGCAYGEEPYSIAMIIDEYLKKEELQINLNIFATDLDENAIKGAIIGKYNIQSLESVNYGVLNKYFEKNGEHFNISYEIKKMVHFSFYDLLDLKHIVPPKSIFGGFVIVFCRNVLIYFDIEYQKIIFDKLYKSLNPNGFLIFGS